MNFEAFPKIARLSREIIVTEKIDGTNAQIGIFYRLENTDGVPNRLIIAEQGDLFMMAGSRNRWISPGDDNYGFAAWVKHNAEELFKLGPGRHFGEWWGRGIQRNYGLEERRFSLFNVSRWAEDCPTCCHVVPILFQGNSFRTEDVDTQLKVLAKYGSTAAPGFMKPEGVVVYHPQSNTMFKKMVENDHMPKGVQ